MFLWMYPQTGLDGRRWVLGIWPTLPGFTDWRRSLRQSQEPLQVRFFEQAVVVYWMSIFGNLRLAAPVPYRVLTHTEELRRVLDCQKRVESLHWFLFLAWKVTSISDCKPYQIEQRKWSTDVPDSS